VSKYRKKVSKGGHSRAGERRGEGQVSTCNGSSRVRATHILETTGLVITEVRTRKESERAIGTHKLELRERPIRTPKQLE
jgi:hypothetical protein